MTERLRYFQRAHSDTVHLRIAFADAYYRAISLYPNAARSSDARITVFAKCLNVSMCAELGLSLFLSQLLKPENFSLHVVANLKDNEKRHVQDEFQQFLKMATVNLFYASIDSSFRTFVKVADPAFRVTKDGFKNNYEHTLKELGIKKGKSALDMLRLSRNTLHTNGYHNASTETIIFHGKKYTFTNGQPMKFLTWSFIAILMYDIRNVLLEIINSKRFANAKQIEDRFIADAWPQTLG